MGKQNKNYIDLIIYSIIEGLKQPFQNERDQDNNQNATLSREKG